MAEHSMEQLEEVKSVGFSPRQAKETESDELVEQEVTATALEETDGPEVDKEECKRTVHPPVADELAPSEMNEVESQHSALKPPPEKVVEAKSKGYIHPKALPIDEILKITSGLDKEVRTGLLLWAKSKELPWSPCMITTIGGESELKKEEGKVHVSWIDREWCDVEWIPIEDTLPFLGLESFKTYAQSMVDRVNDLEEKTKLTNQLELRVSNVLMNRWMKSIEDADSLQRFDVDEREQILLKTEKKPEKQRSKRKSIVKGATAIRQSPRLKAKMVLQSTSLKRKLSEEAEEKSVESSKKPTKRKRGAKSASANKKKQSGRRK